MKINDVRVHYVAPAIITFLTILFTAAMIALTQRIRGIGKGEMETCKRYYRTI